MEAGSNKPRRKIAKKKLVKKVARAPRGRKSTVPPRSKVGVTRSKSSGVGFLSILMILVALAMIAIVVLALLPADLSSKIVGYGDGPVSETPVRNLLPEIQQVALEPAKTLHIGEAELNQYLAIRLKGEQGGPFSRLVTYVGTYADLRPGVMEVFIERRVMGMPLTISCEVRQGFSFDGQLMTTAKASSIGKVPVKKLPLQPILTPFLKIWKALPYDTEALSRIGEFDLREGVIVLGGNA